MITDTAVFFEKERKSIFDGNKFVSLPHLNR
jgi:hypothetical protein